MSKPPQLTPLNEAQQLLQVMELLITMEGFEDPHSPVDHGVRDHQTLVSPVTTCPQGGVRLDERNPQTGKLNC